MESFPVKTESSCTVVNGHPTDIVISKFSDKIFVIITQFGKIGNLIEVRRDVAQKDDVANSTVFSIRFLLGQGLEEVEVAARYLMNYISSDKTSVLLGLSLKDYSPDTLRQIGKLIAK